MRERTRESLVEPVPLRIRLVERTRRCTAPRRLRSRTPDPIAHVRVCRVIDAGAAEIAQILLVLFNLCVAPWKVERDFRHIVDAGVADVCDFQSSRLDALLEGREDFVRAAGRRNRHIADADLFGESQIFIGEIIRDLKRDFDPGSERIESSRSRKQWRSRSSSEQLSEVSARVHGDFSYRCYQDSPRLTDPPESNLGSPQRQVRSRAARGILTSIKAP